MSSSFDERRVHAPNTQIVRDAQTEFRQVMRMWAYFRSDHVGNLTCFAWPKGLDPAALPIDMCCDVERLVLRFCGNSCGNILFLCRHGKLEQVDDVTQVVLGVAFEQSHIQDHYRPVFTNRRAKQDIHARIQAEATECAAQSEASAINDVFGSPEESISEVTGDVSSVDFFGEAQ